MWCLEWGYGAGWLRRESCLKLEECVVLASQKEHQMEGLYGSSMAHSGNWETLSTAVAWRAYRFKNHMYVCTHLYIHTHTHTGEVSGRSWPCKSRCRPFLLYPEALGFSWEKLKVGITWSDTLLREITLATLENRLEETCLEAGVAAWTRMVAVEIETLIHWNRRASW